MDGFNIRFPYFLFFFALTKVEKDMSQGFCNSRDTTKDVPFSDSGS